MQLWMGCILGYGVGAAVWLGARVFTARYLQDAENVDLQWSLRSLLTNAQGQLSVWAAVTQGGLTVWGAFLGWRHPQLAVMFSALLVTGLLAAISLIDFQTRRIPNALVLVLLAWAPVQVLWLGQPSPVAAGLGLLAGGGLMLIVALVGRGAMGAGDVKLAAALGFLLGYPLVISGLLIGIMAGGAAALIILLSGRSRQPGFMAYGPYLALGGWLAYFSMLPGLSSP